MTSAALALALALPSCAVTKSDVSRHRGTPTYTGYSVDYVSATPSPGTLVRQGDVVALSVTVKYLLQRADRGTLSLRYFDRWGGRIGGEHPVQVPVTRGMTTTTTLSQTVLIPRDLDVIFVEVRLTPDEVGVHPASIQVRYPVGRAK